MLTGDDWCCYPGGAGSSLWDFSVSILSSTCLVYFHLLKEPVRSDVNASCISTSCGLSPSFNVLNIPSHLSALCSGTVWSLGLRAEWMAALLTAVLTMSALQCLPSLCSPAVSQHQLTAAPFDVCKVLWVAASQPLVCLKCRLA